MPVIPNVRGALWAATFSCAAVNGVAAQSFMGPLPSERDIVTTAVGELPGGAALGLVVGMFWQEDGDDYVAMEQRLQSYVDTRMLQAARANASQELIGLRQLFNNADALFRGGALSAEGDNSYQSVINRITVLRPGFETRLQLNGSDDSDEVLLTYASIALLHVHAMEVRGQGVYAGAWPQSSSCPVPPRPVQGMQTNYTTEQQACAWTHQMQEAINHYETILRPAIRRSLVRRVDPYTNAGITLTDRHMYDAIGNIGLDPSCATEIIDGIDDSGAWHDTDLTYESSPVTGTFVTGGGDPFAFGVLDYAACRFVPVEYNERNLVDWSYPCATATGECPIAADFRDRYIYVSQQIELHDQFWDGEIMRRLYSRGG